MCEPVVCVCLSFIFVCVCEPEFLCVLDGVCVWGGGVGWMRCWGTGAGAGVESL